METFAAVLTAVFFWAFIAYMAIGNRLTARKTAGQLLVKVRIQSAFVMPARIIFGFGLAISLLWALRTIDNAQSGIPTPPSVLFLGVFVIPLLCLMAFLMVYDLQAEFRRHGLVTPRAGGPFTFAPWSRIRYCKWLSDSMLLVEVDDFKMQIAVKPHHFDKVTAVLVEHVETRDPGVKIINADRLPFEYIDEPRAIKRRRLQFNLKTVLLFMVVASSAFGWLGIHLQAGWREQEAIVELKEFDIRVHYKNGRVDVIYLLNRSKNLTNDDLRHLAAFKRLRVLDLSGTPITDAGLIHIGKLSSLNSLKLDWTHVSDDGLKHIKPLTRLEQLDVGGTKVTDAGLAHIEDLTNLNLLVLDSTQVTDAGLVHLEKMARLKLLNVFSTQVTEEGIKRLQKKLPNLQVE